MGKVRLVAGDDRLNLLKMVAGEDAEKYIMRKRLRPIRCVPTIFTSFNRATVLGGAPVNSVWLVHGPTGSGKSAFSAGIIDSFTHNGHLAGYIDAEHAVDMTWFSSLLDPDAVLFEQPDTLEDTIILVERWIANFKHNKDNGNISQSTCFAIVVDTIHKLVPATELAYLLSAKEPTDKQLAHAADKVDRGWGRYRANLLGAWLDKLTPIVGKNDIALILIAHEREVSAGTNWSEPEYKIKGGQGIVYDAMVRVRVTPGDKVYEDHGGKKLWAGRWHNFIVEKNKVGFPFEEGRFFLSTGQGDAPAGFDLAREIFKESVRAGIIKASGAWFLIDDEVKLQGERACVNYIRDHIELYQQLYEKLRKPNV